MIIRPIKSIPPEFKGHRLPPPVVGPCSSNSATKNLTNLKATVRQRSTLPAIGRSRTSMCYATPGHPVQCALQDQERILSVFAPTMELHTHQIQRSRPNSSPVYVRHRPEKTLLYQIIDEYWPEFQAELASHSKYLPAYVTKEFEEYLKCGRLEHGF